jgi:hypothetical protein
MIRFRISEATAAGFDTQQQQHMNYHKDVWTIDDVSGPAVD